MAATRRSAEESKLLLIEAAVEIIRSEGYGALSARRLAERVGLKRQIVHYYFGTIEDLLIAVVRHYGDSGLARYQQAFRDRDPLQALWELEPDESATSFAFMAMASHEPVIRSEMQKYVTAYQELQAEAVERYFRDRGIALKVPASFVVTMIQSMSQTLAAEGVLGATFRHEETRAAAERMIANLRKRGVIELPG